MGDRLVGLEGFVEAFLGRNLKKAKEQLDSALIDLDPSDEFVKGYKLALQGMISALEGGDELSVARRLVEGRLEGEEIKKLLKQFRSRASARFRPKRERGFSRAWVEVLELILKSRAEPLGPPPSPQARA